jgi:hypothetical protein
MRPGWPPRQPHVIDAAAVPAAAATGDLLDICTLFGPVPPRGSAAEEPGTGSLRALLDRHRVREAVLVSTRALYYDAAGGNREAAQACAEPGGSLLPGAVLDPRLAEPLSHLPAEPRLLCLFPATQAWPLRYAPLTRLLHRLSENARLARIPILCETRRPGDATALAEQLREARVGAPVVFWDVSAACLPEALAVAEAHPAYTWPRTACAGSARSNSRRQPSVRSAWCSARARRPAPLERPWGWSATPASALGPRPWCWAATRGACLLGRALPATGPGLLPPSEQRGMMSAGTDAHEPPPTRIVDVHCGWGWSPTAPGWDSVEGLRDALRARGITVALLASDQARLLRLCRRQPADRRDCRRGSGAFARSAGLARAPPARMAEANAQMRRYLYGERFVGCALYPDPLTGKPVTRRAALELINMFRRFAKPLLVQADTGEAMQEVAAIAEEMTGMRVIASGMGGDDWREAVDLAVRPLNLYLDISGALVPEKIEYALASLNGVRKLVFGSGAPHTDPVALIGLLDDLR